MNKTTRLDKGNIRIVKTENTRKKEKCDKPCEFFTKSNRVKRKKGSIKERRQTMIKSCSTDRTITYKSRALKRWVTRVLGGCLAAWRRRRERGLTGRAKWVRNVYGKTKPRWYLFISKFQNKIKRDALFEFFDAFSLVLWQFIISKDLLYCVHCIDSPTPCISHWPTKPKYNKNKLNNCEGFL